MHEKILGHCKNNFENSLIFSKEKKKKSLLLFPARWSNYLQEWLICSGITQKAERFGFCVFGFGLGRRLMNHFGFSILILFLAV